MDEHRGAVRYDLLKHGYRLEWLGTARLWWGDALAILVEQKASDSAVYRARFPDKYDHDKLIDRVETLAVLITRFTMMQGNQTEIPESDLPHVWDDLFKKNNEPEVELLTFEEIDRRLGWTHVPVAEPAAPMTLEEIDARMGW